MQKSIKNLGFETIGKQPPVTSLILNRIDKWEQRAIATEEFEPFIQVKRSPTIGKGAKVFNPDSAKTHEVLSILETNLLRYLDYLPNVLSVCTQYPLLPIKETLEIAESLAVKHPSFIPKGKNIRSELKIDQAIVMTTDFFIEWVDENGEIHYSAIALKAVNDNGDFSDKSVRNTNINNKLNIEAKFWKKEQRDWHLFTSAMLFNQERFARNLLEADIRRTKVLSKDLLVNVESTIKESFHKTPRLAFNLLIKATAKKLELATGVVRVAFWQLIWQQRLPVDISKEIIFNRPVPLGGSLCVWR